MNTGPVPDPHPLESMDGMQRRRFLGLAAFASAAVVGVGIARPSTAHAAASGCVDEDEPPYRSARGRWDDAERKNYIALHHVGASGRQYGDPCRYAAPEFDCARTGDDKYDFAVNGNGKIAVGGRYRNPDGCHARTCNCEATGIVMLGCFGGCSGPGDVATEAQKCGVGYVWRQAGISTKAEKLKPHKFCDIENPCNGQQVGGPCPGSRYTTSDPTNDYWNSAGLALRNDIRNYAIRGGC